MADTALRPEIALSWHRSGLSGLRADAAPRLDHEEVDTSRPLVRAAAPIVARMTEELDGTSTGVLLADENARILDVQCTQRALVPALADIGARVGVRFGEDTSGTNCLGTAVEIRHGIAVQGQEHFHDAFKSFSCYGHPIVNPVTRRLEGVLDVSSRRGEENPLFAALVRRVVRDIESALATQAPRSHQQLMASFDLKARSFGPCRQPAVVAVGDGLTVATQAALDRLGPADHVLVQSFAAEVQAGVRRELITTLTSGSGVLLRATSASDLSGVVVELLELDPRSDHGATASAGIGSPALVVGETGTGRTTAARATLYADRVEFDAVQAEASRQAAWLGDVERALTIGTRAVLIENVHLLPDRIVVVLARELSRTSRRVVLTTTPEGERAVPDLVSVCENRIELTPLRLRRHEIPRLAQQMMATASQARLTPETLRALTTQRWPGNLRELRRVIDGVASRRTVGDVLPTDLPSSHRTDTGPELPRERAEAEVILAAIRAAGGNKARAAEALGIARSTLYNRINVLHIAVPD